MMKRVFDTIARAAIMATLLSIAVSCGDDDDELKQYLTQGNEERPAWVTGDVYEIYEYTMSVQVTLQSVLLPYVSEEDLMCAVVGDEVRAVTNMNSTGGIVYFPLGIAGNSSNGKVTLKYYSARLKRIYTLEDWMPFDPGMPPTQDGEPYVVNFIPNQE